MNIFKLETSSTDDEVLKRTRRKLRFKDTVELNIWRT